ncbi:MAG: hypothetical protein U5L45_22410 [Saprospiraceae bacterium]|nr:hypothetical protein [Saprospiraceae bacterium]
MVASLQVGLNFFLVVDNQLFEFVHLPPQLVDLFSHFCQTAF